MGKIRWHIAVGLSLLILSAAIYAFQVSSFGKPEDTFFYMLQDFAFLPIQILLVTVVVSEMLGRRERAILHKKMNMVIGAFFSEVGGRLLQRISEFDPHTEDILPWVIVNSKWSDKDFLKCGRALRDRDYRMNTQLSSMDDLKRFLVERRSFMLRLLENPNLLEHETFTELLWAVFHLTEELEFRDGFDHLPQSDLNHIAGDMKRAYVQLLAEWLLYVKHLKDEYPYLFSLVVRVNPFDRESSVIVR